LDDADVDRLIREVEASRKRLEKCLGPILEFEQRAMESATTGPTLLCELVERGSLLSVEEGGDALSLALRETRSRVEKEARALMATRYFGGVYFSYRQTLYLDCVLNAIRGLRPAAKETCLGAVLSTASTIVNSVGKQFAQPMRPRRSDRTTKQRLIGQMCR